MEDANFDRSVANGAITYLHNEEEWARQALADVASGTVDSCWKLLNILCIHT